MKRIIYPTVGRLVQVESPNGMKELSEQWGDQVLEGG